MKNSKQNGLRWLRDAEVTLTQAQKIAAVDHTANVVCFLAEQACQKALKGVLYSDGARQVAIHSIAELAKQVGERHPEILTLREEAATLDQYYLSSRYPDAIAEPAIPAEIFTEDQARRAVAIAREVLEACARILSPK